MESDGSALSPISFSFYVNSLSKEFKCVRLAGCLHSGEQFHARICYSAAAAAP